MRSGNTLPTVNLRITSIPCRKYLQKYCIKDIRVPKTIQIRNVHMGLFRRILDDHGCRSKVTPADSSGSFLRVYWGALKIFKNKSSRLMISFKFLTEEKHILYYCRRRNQILYPAHRPCCTRFGMNHTKEKTSLKKLQLNIQQKKPKIHMYW